MYGREGYLDPAKHILQLMRSFSGSNSKSNEDLSEKNIAKTSKTQGPVLIHSTNTDNRNATSFSQPALLVQQFENAQNAAVVPASFALTSSDGTAKNQSSTDPEPMDLQVECPAELGIQPHQEADMEKLNDPYSFNEIYSPPRIKQSDFNTSLNKSTENKLQIIRSDKNMPTLTSADILRSSDITNQLPNENHCNSKPHSFDTQDVGTPDEIVRTEENQLVCDKGFKRNLRNEGDDEVTENCAGTFVNHDMEETVTLSEHPISDENDSDSTVAIPEDAEERIKFFSKYKNSSPTVDYILQEAAMEANPLNLVSEETKATMEVLGLDKSALQYTSPRVIYAYAEKKMWKPYWNKTKTELRSRLYPSLIEKVLKDSKVACSFHSKNVKRLRDARWIYMAYGHCPCGMNIKCAIGKFTDTELLPLRIVFSGGFSLDSKKATGRQIRNLDRDRIKERLKHDTAKKVFLTDISHVETTRVLHKNQYGNLAVYQKIKMEAKRIGKMPKTFEDKDVDIVNEEFKKDENFKCCKKNGVEGFIQLYYKKPYFIEMFGPQQVRITNTHLQEADLFFDATGRIVKKPFVESKRVLLYSLLGKSDNLPKTLPLCEFLSNKHDTLTIKGGLEKFLISVESETGQSFLPRRMCCDFSFALIHASVQAFNKMELSDYITKMWNCLFENQPMDEKLCCIKLCSSHLIHAFSKNISRKESCRKKRDLAKHVFACFIQTKNLNEYQVYLKNFILLFDDPSTDEETAMKLSENFQKHNFPILEVMSQNFIGGAEDNFFELNMKKDPKLQREKSPYYVHFKDLRLKYYLEKGESEKCTNPCYSREIVDVFQDFYVAYLPLWSDCFPSRGEHMCNAHCESYFHMHKNIFHPEVNQYSAEYLKEHGKIISGMYREALTGVQKTVRKKRETKKKDEESSVIAKEKWKKSRVPRYLLPTLPTVQEEEIPLVREEKIPPSSLSEEQCTSQCTEKQEVEEITLVDESDEIHASPAKDEGFLKMNLLYEDYLNLAPGQWIYDPIMVHFGMSRSCRNAKDESLDVIHPSYCMIAADAENADICFSSEIRKHVRKNCKRLAVPVCFGVHWFAMAVDTEKKTLQVFDSGIVKQYISTKHLIYAAERFRESLIDLYPEALEWRISIGDCCQQSNDFDCGVHTMVNIRDFLRFGETRVTNEQQINEERKSILEDLLTETKEGIEVLNYCHANHCSYISRLRDLNMSKIAISRKTEIDKANHEISEVGEK